MTTRQVWQLDDQGRPRRLVTVQTEEPRQSPYKAILAVLVLIVVVGLVLANAAMYPGVGR